MEDFFHGKGFSKTPISGDESAKFRHMYAAVSQDWAQVKKFLTIIAAIQILYEVIKIGGPVIVVLMGAGYYLKTQGII